MSKFTPPNFNSLQNETSFLGQLNAAMERIKASFDNTLSRDGSVPNQMGADLDVNSNHIVNMAKGTQAGHALEFTQLQDTLDEIDADIQYIDGQVVIATAQANRAESEANSAEGSANSAAADLATMEALLETFNNSFLGTFASNPIHDNSGNPLDVGDLYYNSVNHALMVYDGTDWQDVAAMSPTSINTIYNKIYANAVFRNTFVPETDDGAAIGTTALKFSDLFLATGAVINFNNGNITITHAANRLTFAGGTGGYYFSNTIAPTANDGAPLGSAAVSWSDLFLANGAVINFNNGNVLLTHTANSLALTGVGTNGFSIDGALKVLGGYGTTNGSGDLAIGSTNTGTNNISIAWGDNSGKTLNLGYAAAGVFTPRYKFVDTGAFSPAVNDSAVLGTSALMWSDLFLASGAVINFNNGDYTLTHSSGVLTASGTLAATKLQADSNFYSTVISNNPIISFDSADSISYGRSANTWYFNIGGTTPIYVNGTTIGPGANDLTSLGTSGTAFSDLFLATGAVISFGNNNVVLTHSSGNLTVTTGNLRATTQSAGDNSTKVATTAYVDAGISTANKPIDLVFVIGDGVNTISAGIKGYLPVDFSGTINSWTVVGNASGSIVIELWKANNAVPNSGNKITASAGPTLSSAQYAKSSTLTGWTTSFSAGDVFGINVTGTPTTVKQITLAVKATKS